MIRRPPTTVVLQPSEIDELKAQREKAMGKTSRDIANDTPPHDGNDMDNRSYDRTEASRTEYTDSDIRNHA